MPPHLTSTKPTVQNMEAAEKAGSSEDTPTQDLTSVIGIKTSENIKQDSIQDLSCSFKGVENMKYQHSYILQCTKPS